MIQSSSLSLLIITMPLLPETSNFPFPNSLGDDNELRRCRHLLLVVEVRRLSYSDSSLQKFTIVASFSRRFRRLLTRSSISAKRTAPAAPKKWKERKRKNI